MKKIGESVRQGDVLLIRAAKSAVTKDYKSIPSEGGRVVIAVGETSLHSHVMRDPNVCMLRREGVSDRVLTVESRLVDLILEGGESAPGVPRHAKAPPRIDESTHPSSAGPARPRPEKSANSAQSKSCLPKECYTEAGRREEEA